MGARAVEGRGGLRWGRRKGAVTTACHARMINGFSMDSEVDVPGADESGCGDPAAFGTPGFIFPRRVPYPFLGRALYLTSPTASKEINNA